MLSRVGIERPLFTFSGKPSINVELEDQNNLLEYFKLFITPEIAELICRVTNIYAQQFFENNSDLKLKSGVHHWNDASRGEIMKSLALILLQGLHQKPDNKSCFSRRKIVETSMFLELFTEKMFCHLLKFL
jgi:hypothetical protein